MALVASAFTCSTALARVLATAASGSSFSSSRLWMSSKAAGDAAPSYVYASPGSSIRDPVLTGHSMSNADVYHYDPRPAATPQPPQKSKAAQPIHKVPPPTRPTAAFAAQQVQQQQQQRAAAAEAEAASSGAPTYVYTPPGSSISGPSYGFSVRDPVYVVDPAPSPAAAATKQPPAQQQQQQAAASPAPGRKRVGLPIDDLAQAPYATSPRGSMHEPKYVSISDPHDVAAARK